MKVVVSKYEEQKPYRDTRGEVVIELEGDETIDDVIEEYITKLDNRMFYQQYYEDPREITEYIDSSLEWTGNYFETIKTVYKGKFVLLTVTTPNTN